MKMWTDDGHGEWRAWSHAEIGLDAVAAATPLGGRVFAIENGPDEDEQLLALIRLIRRLGQGRVVVIAASQHPSACWRNSVLQAGADMALFVPALEKHGRQDINPLRDSLELGDSVCPELHARSVSGVTVSVCGRHQDRMVLARHHFDCWCLRTKDRCPHWRGEVR